MNLWILILLVRATAVTSAGPFKTEATCIRAGNKAKELPGFAAIDFVCVEQ